MIKEFEFYHGVIFTKLIHESNSRILIEPFPTESNASYIINSKVGIYIKHSTKRLTPWRFSLSKIHQDEILQMKDKLEEVFLLLVCGEDGVVVLSFNELKRILDEVHGEVEWISATRTPRKEYAVKGSDGSLGKKVGKNEFPRKIFAYLNATIKNA